jgi:hypothetical protein
MFRLTASLVIALGFFTTGCSSMSTLPEKENLKVSRDAADKDCHLIGKLEGRTQSKTPKQEEALEDLKQEAANKGANYLQVLEYSSLGTAVTGMAYHCP